MEKIYQNVNIMILRSFFTDFSIIKLLLLILFIVVNFTIFSELFYASKIAIQGNTTIGVIENIASRPSISSKCITNPNRVLHNCTKYNSVIGFDDENNIHHSFESKVIGRLPIGSEVFVLYNSKGSYNPKNTYTGIGFFLYIVGLSMCIYMQILIYLIIGVNYHKVLRKKKLIQEKNNYKNWIGYWGLGLFVIVFGSGSLILYYQGHTFMATISIILLFTGVYYILKSSKKNNQ